jgi:hypothetical protein
VGADISSATVEFGAVAALTSSNRTVQHYEPVQETMR